MTIHAGPAKWRAVSLACNTAADHAGRVHLFRGDRLARPTQNVQMCLQLILIRRI